MCWFSQGFVILYYCSCRDVENIYFAQYCLTFIWITIIEVLSCGIFSFLEYQQIQCISCVAKCKRGKEHFQGSIQVVLAQ